jgi:hypothetical protein
LAKVIVLSTELVLQLQGDTFAPWEHEQPGGWVDSINNSLSSSSRFVHKRPEYDFYHSAQVLDFHERKATDTAISLPTDQGEFISGPDGCFFPNIFWEHHLSAIINAQYGFYLTTGTLVTARKNFQERIIHRESFFWSF